MSCFSLFSFIICSIWYDFSSICFWFCDKRFLYFNIILSFSSLFFLIISIYSFFSGFFDSFLISTISSVLTFSFRSVSLPVFFSFSFIFILFFITFGIDNNNLFFCSNSFFNCSMILSLVLISFSYFCNWINNSFLFSFSFSLFFLISSS
jgi:hypothetical protein